ncbi:MAG: methyltransferase small [Caulobacter sp.]|nr:methyltransferase small [Caulobacter sp.]
MLLLGVAPTFPAPQNPPRMSDLPVSAIYGSPSFAVVDLPGDAVQVSPLSPGSQDLAALPAASLDEIVVLAPPGVVERRYVLAQALTALKPGGRLTALALKDRGGQRLNKELTAFGCVVGESAKRHHRIAVALRPETLQGVDEALAAGAPQRVTAEQLWSQPGVFSWDRLDPGTALLIKTLPELSGIGADFGGGVGWLARPVLASTKVAALTVIDLDRRAVEAARRNLDDPRVRFAWTDVRQAAEGLDKLDFVVSNPPFHDAGTEDKTLGQGFIAAAAGALRKGGVLWLVANRHLPYEAALAESFSKVRMVVETSGFKVFEARK